MTDTRLNAPGGTIGSETKFSTRGPVSPTTDISSTDNLSILGDGAFNPLHVSAAWLAQQVAALPSGGNRQTFRVSRQAGDTDVVVISVARGFVARPNTNYNVQATLKTNAGSVVLFGCDALQLTQFTLTLSAPWQAGDSVMFTVEDLT